MMPTSKFSEQWIKTRPTKTVYQLEKISFF